ncbi:MAG: 2-hydroxyacyl-CoA dehydratase family protein [Syntrophales bacterium]|nr:2-hydroxyacyl-CoA dehydratase family protein [Syntrophales bacterium]
MSAQAASPGKEGLGMGRFAMETSQEIFGAIFAYYAGLKKAKEEGRPVIWTTGLLPREIFHAVDATVVYLEHLPFIMGFQALGSHYTQIAEEHGFSKDVCAFHRVFVGCGVAKENEREPVWDQFYVAPDLIIGGNYPCMSQTKSFMYLVDHFKVPYHYFDTPINTWGTDPPDYAIEYTAGELKGVIDFLGKQGFKLDWEKLKENVRLSKKTLLLWNEINDQRKIPPTVMTAMDGLVTALILTQVLPPAPLNTLFEKFLKELKEKREKKLALIGDEKARLMFAGVPPLFNMQLFDSLERHGAVVVTEMLECATGGAYDPSYIDPEKPLESLAHKLLIDVVNPITTNMIEHIVQDVKDFKIDGVVAVVKRSCGLLPGFWRQTKDAVYKETGVPTTIFDLDALDSREYDDVAINTKFDSFIETVIANKS